MIIELKETDLEFFHVIDIKIDDVSITYGKDKVNCFFWNEIVIETDGFFDEKNINNKHVSIRLFKIWCKP